METREYHDDVYRYRIDIEPRTEDTIRWRNESTVRIRRDNDRVNKTRISFNIPNGCVSALLDALDARST